MRSLLLGCALACALLACLARGQKCNATQYAHGGKCCSRCSPGQKVRTECSGESDTTCEECEPHHFQGNWTKEKYCTPHRDCDHKTGLVVDAAGTAERNTVCRCKEGTHCSSHECQTCRDNKRCGPGEGVQKEGGGAEDTVCVTCPHGFFSNISSATAQCQPWSSCQAQQLVAKGNGTRVSDVTCVGPPPPATEEAQRTRSVLVASVSLAVAAALIGGVVWHLKCRDPHKLHKNQVCAPETVVIVAPPEEGRQRDPLAFGRQQPEEQVFEEDKDEDCPALPIQETLLGGQPVAQEDGKDSRLAEQEQL